MPRIFPPAARCSAAPRVIGYGTSHRRSSKTAGNARVRKPEGVFAVLEYPSDGDVRKVGGDRRGARLRMRVAKFYSANVKHQFTALRDYENQGGMPAAGGRPGVLSDVCPPTNTTKAYQQPDGACEGKPNMTQRPGGSPLCRK